MSWWGKVLGGAFGYMLGGPLGALLGAALGHKFDQGLHIEPGAGFDPGQQERVQTAFFTATFSVMGHVAKADGRVSPDEIRLAEQVMAQMRLDGAMRKAAQALFREGKSPDFDLDAVLDQFRRECHRRRHLVVSFLEIQLAAALADGSIAPGERRVLEYIATRLGVSPAELTQLEALVAGLHGGGGGQARRPATEDELAAAYRMLGVTPEASDAEVKKAYRRLMNQHHPDKLVAKGLPEEMIRVATERTQQIKAAYERIRKARRG